MPYAQLPNAQAFPVQGLPGAYPTGELRGIGGWLMFLVLCLTIFGPIASFFAVIYLLASAGEVSNTHPEIVSFITVLLLLILANAIWGLVVGVRLWKVRLGAATRAKQYFLWGSTAFSVITGFLPVIMLPPADQVDQAVPAAILRSAIGVGFAILWYFYFTKSRRVANTFPQG
jgi:magnesium-transporting ATPase (P-type)